MAGQDSRCFPRASGRSPKGRDPQGLGAQGRGHAREGGEAPTPLHCKAFPVAPLVTFAARGGQPHH